MDQSTLAAFPATPEWLMLLFRRLFKKEKSNTVKFWVFISTLGLCSETWNFIQACLRSPLLPPGTQAERGGWEVAGSARHPPKPRRSSEPS